MLTRSLSISSPNSSPRDDPRRPSSRRSTYRPRRFLEPEFRIFPGQPLAHLLNNSFRPESNPDPLDFVEGNLILGAIVQLGRARRFVRRDLLRMLERSAVLNVGRDAGRAECVTAGGVGQGRCLRSPF